jgi:hypothetical protein
MKPVSLVLRLGVVAAIATTASTTVISGAAAEGGDGGDLSVVNLYAKPVDRHPTMTSATRFRMLSFGGREGWVPTDYAATVRLGVERNGRPARALITKRITGHTNGRTPFALRLTPKDRRTLRAAAEAAHRRTVIAEIQPRPTGKATGGRRIGERRGWLILIR